jgi:NADH dehydrogenase FAD-containing subunit
MDADLPGGQPGLSARDIAAPLRHILRNQANATVRLDEALSIDLGARRVALAGGGLSSDFLSVATGVELAGTLAEKTRAQLRKLGVEVRTGRAVTAIDAEDVTMGDVRIESRTVLWAADTEVEKATAP